MTSLQFRVLFREFLFRMVDREVLSAHAQGDVSKLLGRFATILILISLPFAGMALTMDARMSHEETLVAAWTTEHALIAATMLIVGLFTVLSWDSTFPDRRDVLVLAPLPVRISTIFFAKTISLAAALSLKVAIFNAAPGLGLPFILASPSTNLFGIIFSLGLYRALFAYWIAMLAAGAFVFCCALIVRGVSTQLPRRFFLRISALLQMAAFCLFVGVYFLTPSLAFPKALSATSNQRLLDWLPSYWFLGLFQQLNGSLPTPGNATLIALAKRAWVGSAVAIAGAGCIFLLSYHRTLRKIVEEPDIAPCFNRRARLPKFVSPAETAIVHFSIRTLLRSRPHRVIFSFYAGIGFAILILFLKTPVAQKLSAASEAASGIWWLHASLPLLASSFLMLFFWMLGIRVVFALPFELRANWIFRITERRGAHLYLAASRKAMLVLALLPVWTASAILFLSLWPPRPAVEHLLALGLAGIALVELCLYNFQKIPFTCSYLPGKSNLHITSLLCLLGGLNVTFWGAEFERRALSDPVKYAWIIATLCLAVVCARWRTEGGRSRGDRPLYFEEELSPVIASLGLHRDGILAIDPPDPLSSSRQLRPGVVATLRPGSGVATA